MSAIIKGIKIPKYTGEHKEFDRYGGFLTVYKNGKVELHIFDTDIFDTDFTIESISTPHGRLIDADKLTQWIEYAFSCYRDGDKDTVKLVINDIKRQSTIIEAEE